MRLLCLEELVSTWVLFLERRESNLETKSKGCLLREETDDGKNIPALKFYFTISSFLLEG